MKEFNYIIKDSFGIHTRPAGTLVKEAGRFKSEITIKKAGKEVDLKKILALMGLGVKMNDEITLNITGEDEEEAYLFFKEFFENNL